MARSELSEAQHESLEFIKSGYMCGALGAARVVDLLKDAGLSVSQRIEVLEVFAIQKGIAVAKKDAS